MKRVLIESPYAGTPIERARNIAYARACLADSIRRGEAPWCSHLVYTQPGVLCDELPEERARGIEIGLQWGAQAELTAVYTDLGVTAGMVLGCDRAAADGRPVEYRSLPPAALAEARTLAGGWL